MGGGGGGGDSGGGGGSGILLVEKNMKTSQYFPTLFTCYCTFYIQLRVLARNHLCLIGLGSTADLKPPQLFYIKKTIL